jgi:predicted RNase H-like nuclease
LVNKTLKSYGRNKVAPDDILDAMAAAIIGKISKGYLQTLPDQPEIDQAGLPMEIAYTIPVKKSSKI